jgi:murein endopeptidase
MLAEIPEPIIAAGAFIFMCTGGHCRTVFASHQTSLDVALTS